MDTTKKIALGVAGAAVVVASTFALAATSFAAGPQPTPAAGQPGGGFGRMGGAMPGRMGGMGGMAQAGPMRGAGYGAAGQAAYLAGKLGVPEADVAKALDAYRATHTPTVRGRDRDAAALAADHDALATSLAEQLKVDKAKVLEALDAMPQARQAERTAQLKAQLDKAVADGRLTQAQADAIVAAHESGAMGMMGRGRR